MFLTSALIRLTRRLGTVSVAVVATGLTAIGSASAAPADADAVGARRLDILGVPLGTATWALLGVMLLISGFVAASRSGRRPVSPAPTFSTLGSESPTEAGAVEIPVRQIRVVDTHVTVSGNVSTV